MIDGDVPVFSELGTPEILMFLGMGIALAGGIIALRWQRNGGLLLFVGSALFMIIDSISGGTIRLNPIFLTLLIVGSLFLYLSSESKK